MLPLSLLVPLLPLLLSIETDRSRLGHSELALLLVLLKVLKQGPIFESVLCPFESLCLLRGGCRPEQLLDLVLLGLLVRDLDGCEEGHLFTARYLLPLQLLEDETLKKGYLVEQEEVAHIQVAHGVGRVRVGKGGLFLEQIRHGFFHFLEEEGQLVLVFHNSMFN